MKNLSLQFTKLRAEKGLTVLELSEEAGVPEKTINMFENGFPGISIGDLLRLSQAIGTTLDIEFVKGE